MNPIDGELYRRLEVGPRASHDEIVRSYRRLAHRAHPDTHPEDPDASRRFRELTDAYDVLADPSRRARYDQTLRHVDPFPGVGPFSGTVALRAGPVRIDPDPPWPAAAGAGLAAPIDAVLSRLFSCLIGEGWPW